jgi:hypothetical protein
MSSACSVYVVSNDAKGNEESLGKFEIPRRALEPAERGAPPPPPLDGWFPLTNSNKHTEMNGEVRHVLV